MIKKRQKGFEKVPKTSRIVLSDSQDPMEGKMDSETSESIKPVPPTGCCAVFSQGIEQIKSCKVFTVALLASEWFYCLKILCSVEILISTLFF